MSDALAPDVLFTLIASHVPSDLKDNILIVGSIAAAYHYRSELIEGGVRTKDADVMIQPAGAIAQSREIAMRLLNDGWRRTDKCFARETKDHTELRAIRLYPPSTSAYFIELLAFPYETQQVNQEWIPVQLEDGWYGLPSFRFLGLSRHGALHASNGLTYASPAMMALANLLAHRTIGKERMSEPIGGRSLLRAAKDLGRVLALARLTSRDDIEQWPVQWSVALQTTFPSEAAALAKSAGDGLNALIRDSAALEEARHAVDVGLLSGYQVTVEQMVAIARQVQVDALDRLTEELARLS